MKWMFVLVLALLAGLPRVAHATVECYQFNTAQGKLDGISGYSGCFPTLEEAANHVYTVGIPVAETPRYFQDTTEYNKIIRGPCKFLRYTGDDRVSGTPEFWCDYTVLTTIVFKNDGHQSVLQGSGWLLFQNTCVATRGKVWDPDSLKCLGRVERKTKDPVQAQSCPAADPKTTYGNPIDVITGMKSQREFIVGWGRGHGLTLSYDPTDRMLGADGLPNESQGFSRVWYGNYHKSMRNVGPNWRSLRRGSGQIKTYTSASEWIKGEKDPAPADSSGGYLYFDTAAEAIEAYQRNNIGDLFRIDYIDGRRLDLIYIDVMSVVTRPPQRVLKTVIDETGRTLTFEYEPDATASATGALRVKNVLDVAGRSYGFSYTDAGGIATISYPDGTTRQYGYERADLPWAITSLVDENGQVFGTYGYDDAGRAISTRTGSVGPEWSVTWTQAPQWGLEETKDLVNSVLFKSQRLQTGGVATLTMPNGNTATITSSEVAGSPTLTSKTQPAGSGCEAASHQIEHDADANVIRRVDFNSHQSCHAYVTGRRLESSRVEGLAAGAACAPVMTTGASLPAGARKVSSQWHPDWRKASKVAEPRRITTFVYNGQPDPFNGNAVANCVPSAPLMINSKPIVVLCKQVEQATTDETGALGFNATLQAGVPARATSWTYDATGQVLTETDALNRVVVTNEYYTDTTTDHTKGDLRSTTNALNQKTSFLRYDAYGKPLEMVDANALTTTYVYDLRERLTSVTAGGTTTSYEYFPTGLLKRSAQPDGSAVSYEYDDAHRLVAASDTRGNRIDYTLDQSGNRTGESAKDPNGTLRRTMSRAFDALGRAHQTTGRE